MLLSLVAATQLLLATGLEARSAQLTLEGQPRALYAADATGDGQLDGLVVLARASGRAVALVDAAGLVRGALPAPVVLAIPDDAAFFGVCPAVAPGLLVVRADGIDQLRADGSKRRLAALEGALPLAEVGDLPLVELCPHVGGGPLAVPTLRGVALVDAAGAVTPLAVPRRAYLTEGSVYRGPRARRDFSLMTTLIHPRPFGGELDGDQRADLAFAIEEELGLFPAAGAPSRRLLPLRTQAQRAAREGTVETQLADLTGDGLLDAVISWQRGGSDSMRTTWKVFSGPLTRSTGAAVAGVAREGLATPLLVGDVDLDGVSELLEPLVDTGVIAMGKALVTGRINVQYRVHRVRDGRHLASEPLVVAHDIDFSRATNLSGHPPLVGADFNGDGRGDFVALGRADEVALHLGTGGDPPFKRSPEVEVTVPSTRQAVSLRRGRGGPPTLLLLDEQRGASRLTAITFRADQNTPARRRSR